ncbi:MAG: acetylglutamate kinase [Candidatus Pelagibacter sp.]
MNIEKILPKDGPSIEEVKKYIEKYFSEIIVIKCGGSVLIDKNLFDQFIEDISIVNKLGLSSIVIHGGGKNIKKKLDEHNIESKFINGLRVTDEKNIKIVEESLLDLNLEILKNINNNQAKAQSVTPRDENLIKVIQEKKELGLVGIPKEINKHLLLKIINEKKVPVIIPMGVGEDKKIYNINADVAAGAIAKELNSRRLLLMTDVEGLLDKNKKLILEINLETAKKMLDEGTISGGMIPKINTCIDAVENGVTGVVIVDGRKPHSILYELFSDKGSGTLIRRQ